MSNEKRKSDSTATALFECPPDGEVAGYDGPGWYFHDESYHLHGPFSTVEECTECETSYLERL